MEDYHFDVPEGMDLMVHDRRRGLYGSDIRQDRHMGLTHVCQTLLCDTRDKLDTMNVDSLTEAFTEDVQDTDYFYQRIVSSDEEDFGVPDDEGLLGLTPVRRTVWCDSRDGLDTRDIDSVLGGFAEKLTGTADIYQELVSSDDEDFSEPDDGSVRDLEMNTCRIGVVPHLRLHLTRFRRKRPIHGRQLCSVTACFQGRS